MDSVSVIHIELLTSFFTACITYHNACDLPSAYPSLFRYPCMQQQPKKKESTFRTTPHTKHSFRYVNYTTHELHAYHNMA